MGVFSVFSPIVFIMQLQLIARDLMCCADFMHNWCNQLSGLTIKFAYFRTYILH